MSKKYRFPVKKDREKIYWNGKNAVEQQLAGLPRLELFSNLSFTLEGCKGILEYRDDYIKMKISKGSVTLCGEKLTVVSFQGKNIQIAGRIFSLEFSVAKGEGQ
ncbi:MAG: YabP/YqfC family sporulation protein [Clostridia bacterium]|nr:YabP/YqfC family sporulation protein [Clostridia bacterium]